MQICKWEGCGAPITDAMNGECFRCWALRSRIELRPDLARRMLASIIGCPYCDLFHAKGIPCECGK